MRHIAVVYTVRSSAFTKRSYKRFQTFLRKWHCCKCL